MNEQDSALNTLLGIVILLGAAGGLRWVWDRMAKRPHQRKSYEKNILK